MPEADDRLDRSPDDNKIHLPHSCIEPPATDSEFSGSRDRWTLLGAEVGPVEPRACGLEDPRENRQHDLPTDHDGVVAVDVSERLPDRLGVPRRGLLPKACVVLDLAFRDGVRLRNEHRRDRGPGGVGVVDLRVHPASANGREELLGIFTVKWESETNEVTKGAISISALKVHTDRQEIRRKIVNELTRASNAIEANLHNLDSEESRSQ